MYVLLLTAFAFGFVVWHSYRVCAHHRLYWGGGLFPPAKLWIRSIIVGVLAGAIVSGIMYVSGWGDTVRGTALWWLWATALVLGAFRLRWMNVSTVTGFICLLALIRPFIDVSHSTILHGGVKSLAEIDPVHMLALAGIATVLFGAIIVWQGDTLYCPVLLPRRGKAVGAFLLQSVTVFPVIINSAGNWLLFPLPLVYSDIAIVHSREQRAKLTGFLIAGHGIVLTVLAYVAGTYPSFVWVSALWAFLVPEVMTRLVHRLEHNGVPKFHNVNDGVRILDVVSKSPAAEMGLRSGETIKSVNGQAVNNMIDVYAAIKQSPAYCKLIVTDQWGEDRIAQRSLYDGDSHQLGIIPVTPSPHDMQGNLHMSGWWHLLVRRTVYKRQHLVDTRGSVHP